VTVLKRLSDALLVLAVFLAIAAVFGPTWLWWAAASCLLGSFVLAGLRRRAAKAARQT